MNTAQVVVLGSGFAGLWGAVGAARKREELGLSRDQIQITLVNRDAYHSIRVRNYESDLSSIRVPLDAVLRPIDVQRVEATVKQIDVVNQAVAVESNSETRWLAYDRLVIALGSALQRPPIPGLADYGFDVDTYSGATRLDQHLKSLPGRVPSPGQWTVLIVGAGLTGIEVATEMPGRLQQISEAAKASPQLRVILADHHPTVGSDMGESARPVIEEALNDLEVETCLGIEVCGVDPEGVTLKSGERIEASTVIWCAGMRSNPLMESLPVERDRFGRVAVDNHLKVRGLQNVFAAGDCAWMMVDDNHASVMSCQHGRPMGRFAGHNVVCDLVGEPMLPLHIDWYVTVLDLGPWGAVYTNGWDRQVVLKGAAAKKVKQEINCRRIYPPANGTRKEILDAAAPEVQKPPGYSAFRGSEH